MTKQRSGAFTCVLVANQLGADSPPAPVPVHMECWDARGESGGWTRVFGAQKFVVKGEWRSSLDAENRPNCHLCGEQI